MPSLRRGSPQRSTFDPVEQTGIVSEDAPPELDALTQEHREIPGGTAPLIPPIETPREAKIIDDAVHDELTEDPCRFHFSDFLVETKGSPRRKWLRSKLRVTRLGLTAVAFNSPRMET